MRRRAALILDVEIGPTTCAHCRGRVGWARIDGLAWTVMVDRVPEPERVEGLDLLQLRPHACPGKPARSAPLKRRARGADGGT